ncbi:MAG: beta-hydroxyacyl-ACP dehydratase [Planctomycetaceae bacterium]|nr:beta-hydroxyacyl-ACP dehydratase [Planctomycetaceae bacterium]
MTSSQYLNLIPNRPPYLWVDDVVDIDDHNIHTRKFIDPKLDLFSGHYPDFPVFPAALHCECAFQASAIRVAHLGVSTGEKVPVVTRADRLKFKRMVRPGDVLDVHVRLQDRVIDVFFLKARILCDGETATTLDFVTTAASRETTE